MAKGIVSEQEWDKGSSAQGGSEKAGQIIAYLTKLKGGATTTRISEETGIKWPYSTCISLRKLGTLEVKKIGKANYFRLKRAKAK